MPRRPPSPCPAPGCAALVRDGAPCPVHGQARRPFATARRASSLYNTSEWRALRDDHKRIEPTCRVGREQGRICHGLMTVDHIVAPRGDAHLFFDPTNLQTLCPLHHNSKTVTEINERRRRHAVWG